MRVMTILGTRPEIIRLSRIIPALDRAADHVLVHTGQNFRPELSGLFFDDLGVRQPDLHLDAGAPDFGTQVGRILAGVSEAIASARPDRVVILGDTNSGLSALTAARAGVPVFHLEAGNRCYDPRVPEELNRRVIDHASAVLMPYTHRSAANLVREGIERERVFVVGNPINEVMRHYADRIDASTALDRLSVEPGGYFLATLHRAETVDVPERLRAAVASLGAVTERWGAPVLLSTHPHTADRLARDGVASVDGVRLIEPVGFFDFGKLERGARCVLTDSGTVQEECCILRLPNVTLRDVTERPETVECGSSILAGVEAENVLRAVEAATEAPPAWTPPPEYLVPDVTSAALNVILGRHLLIREAM